MRSVTHLHVARNLSCDDFFSGFYICVGRVVGAWGGLRACYRFCFIFVVLLSKQVTPHVYCLSFVIIPISFDTVADVLWLLIHHFFLFLIS